MCFGEKNEIDPIWGWSLHLSYLVGGCGRVVGAVSGSRCWCGVAAERRSNSQNGGRQSLMENLPMLAPSNLMRGGDHVSKWLAHVIQTRARRGRLLRNDILHTNLAILPKLVPKSRVLGHFQLLDKTAWMHLKCVLCKRIYTFYFSHMSETQFKYTPLLEVPC